MSWDLECKAVVSKFRPLISNAGRCAMNATGETVATRSHKAQHNNNTRLVLCPQPSCLPTGTLWLDTVWVDEAQSFLQGRDLIVPLLLALCECHTGIDAHGLQIFHGLQGIVQ